MNIKKFLFPALLVCAVLTLVRRVIARTVPVEPVTGSTSYDDIERYVQQQMHRLKIPGASLAIIEGERIVRQGGFGRARPGGEVPAALTPFFIGSLTKSITALAVMQLVEAGKVKLDDPVQHYLPWFRVADPEASAQMTVRHLLNQTSGLPSLAGMIKLDFDHSDAMERQVRALSTLKLIAPVGAKCEYSNLNYNVLGLIIEAASGESYTDYIQTHVFDPLDMCHSYTSREEAKQNGLAMGYRHWFGYPFPARDLPVPLGSLPSGQLISCTEDMAHYLIAHLNGGRFSGLQILSSSGMDELHRGEAEYVTFGIPSGRYGMGWFDMDIGQTKTFSHSGNVPDFSAFMALIPEQRKGLIVLFNADPYGLPPVTEEIGSNLIALLAGRQPAPIKLDFIQWVMRLVPLIPLLQLAGVIITLRSLPRWRQDPPLHLKWGRHILLPLIPNLSLMSILIYFWSSGVLSHLHYFNPDLAWIARLSGGFGGIWVLLRTGLVLWAAKTFSSPRT